MAEQRPDTAQAGGSSPPPSTRFADMPLWYLPDSELHRRVIEDDDEEALDEMQFRDAVDEH